ncbi:MAG: hypothetical protein Q8P97_01610 [bacterium]|nr:hypothetical protein [bacterium]
MKTTGKRGKKKSRQTRVDRLFAANEALAAQLQASEVEAQEREALWASQGAVRAARSTAEGLIRDLEVSGTREKALIRDLDAELDRGTRLTRALDDLNHALGQTRNIATALVAMSARSFMMEYSTTLLATLEKLGRDLVTHEPIARTLVADGYKLVVEHAEYVLESDAKDAAVRILVGDFLNSLQEAVKAGKVLEDMGVPGGGSKSKVI